MPVFSFKVKARGTARQKREKITHSAYMFRPYWQVMAGLGALDCSRANSKVDRYTKSVYVAKG